MKFIVRFINTPSKSKILTPLKRGEPIERVSQPLPQPLPQFTSYSNLMVMLASFSFD